MPKFFEESFEKVGLSFKTLLVMVWCDASQAPATCWVWKSGEGLRPRDEPPLDGDDGRLVDGVQVASAHHQVD